MKFAFQYNPDTKRLSYNQHSLSKVNAAAIALNDGLNPYASLVFRAAEDLTTTLQGSTTFPFALVR